MPKKNNKKNSKKSKGYSSVERVLLTKEPGQEYACILKRLGGPMLSVKCCDGTLRLAKIRGKLMKRCWMKEGDWILVSLRDFNDKKVDVIHKFNEDEVRKLRKSGDIFDIKIEGEDTFEEEDTEDVFVFEDI